MNRGTWIFALHSSRASGWLERGALALVLSANSFGVIGAWSLVLLPDGKLRDVHRESIK